MKLIKTLANLGYGSRREVEKLIRAGMVTNLLGASFTTKDNPEHHDILIDGEPLDPIAPLTLILNKPTGYTCSTEDPGDTIYDLLPPRFSKRNPGLNPVGRLDKDTSGLLLITDDGKFLHRVIHPKSHCHKTYHATLDRPLNGSESDVFGSGTLMLESESKPLLPAHLRILSEKEALITLHEGRYHQVRRMFAALGNHVLELKRISIGGLKLPADLAEGNWCVLSQEESVLLFQPQNCTTGVDP